MCEGNDGTALNEGCVHGCVRVCEVCVHGCRSGCMEAAAADLGSSGVPIFFAFSRERFDSSFASK